MQFDLSEYGYAELFGKYLAGLLVTKAVLPAADFQTACEVIAAALEDEEDIGTVDFKQPPNWLFNIDWDEYRRPQLENGAEPSTESAIAGASAHSSPRRLR